MACVEPNVLTFMGDHWFLTLILALIVGNYILRPVAGRSCSPSRGGCCGDEW